MVVVFAQVLDLKCKGIPTGTECVISQETFGKMCKRCRYTKCLNLGMRTDQVIRKATRK